MQSFEFINTYYTFSFIILAVCCGSFYKLLPFSCVIIIKIHFCLCSLFLIALIPNICVQQCRDWPGLHEYERWDWLRQDARSSGMSLVEGMGGTRTDSSAGRERERVGVRPYECEEEEE